MCGRPPASGHDLCSGPGADGGARTRIGKNRTGKAIRFFCEKAKERMLRTSAEVPWDEYRNIKPYMDPALRVKGTLLRALLYMYRAGMVAFCSTVQETVSLFTVVKNYDENGVCVQRIV